MERSQKKKSDKEQSPDCTKGPCQLAGVYFENKDVFCVWHYLVSQEEHGSNKQAFINWRETKRSIYPDIPRNAELYIDDEIIWGVMSGDAGYIVYQAEHLKPKRIELFNRQLDRYRDSAEDRKSVV